MAGERWIAGQAEEPIGAVHPIEGVADIEHEALLNPNPNRNQQLDGRPVR